MKNELKFKGILKDFNYTGFNKGLVVHLIKIGVYEQDISVLSKSLYNSPFLEEMLCFDGNVYFLNKIFLEEIYSELYSFIVDMQIDNIMEIEKEINLNIKKNIGKTEKIKFIKKKHKELFEYFKIDNDYFYYGIDSEINPWDKWKERVCEIDSTIPELIINHLLNEEYRFSHMNEFKGLGYKYPSFAINLNKWSRYFSYNFISTKLKKELSNLEGLENEINNTPPQQQKFPKTLKELFEKPEQFDDVINLLVKKEIVLKTDKGYEIKIPKTYQNKGGKFFICSVGMQLNNKKYLFKGCDGEPISKAFNLLFINSKITRQNYNALKDSNNQSDYLKHTAFLPLNIT